MCQQSMLEVMSQDDDNIIFSDEKGEQQCLAPFPGSCGAKSFGHAEKFLRRAACEDSSELSSFNGSPVPGDAGCMVV